MSKNRCIDAMADWHTTGGHYDARVVRVCQPGASEETDPGADGHWVEPSDWDGRTITGLRIAGAYVITDDYPLSIEGVDKAYQIDPGTSFYGDRNPPRTGEDWWARIRTKYQNGDVRSEYHAPESCLVEPVWPWDC